MEILPAIDIMHGEVVRLTKGEFASKEVLSKNPLDVLRTFKNAGAKNLHIVDLDGAKDGELVNYYAIKMLTSDSDILVEVGGGIRDERRIQLYLESGVKRVILGTIAIENFDFVRKMAAKYGSAIAVGVDAKNGFVATNGWKTVTEVESFGFCKKCYQAGVQTIIYTDIDTDGAMSGTNLAAFSKLSEIRGLKIIASGGISYKEEILKLQEIGVYGAILGKALYKGMLNLEEVLELVK